MLSKYRTPVYEFLLFLTLVVLVVMGADLFVFAVSRKKPGTTEFVWSIGMYCVLWIVAGVRNHFRWDAETIEKIHAKPESPMGLEEQPKRASSAGGKNHPRA